MDNIPWTYGGAKKTKLLSVISSKDHQMSFATQCDWVIGMRWQEKNINCYGNPNVLPSKIFVQVRALKFFMNNIYTNIPKHHRYILLIGDEDDTTPRQIDRRFANSANIKKNDWKRLVTDDQIIHIFVNHLDIPATNKISPFPIGFNPSEYQEKALLTKYRSPKFNVDILCNVPVSFDNRQLKVLMTARIRKGPQWKDRQTVKELANSIWKDFSVVPVKEIPNHLFFTEIQKYSFMYCPHGGGIEPNPNAFTAIYCGTIPIMKRFVNCDILFEGLPVIFIDDWKEDQITIERLEQWRDQLKDSVYNPDSRKKVLERLTTEYWVSYIENRCKESPDSIK